VWDRIHGIVAGAINRVWSIIRTVGHKIHAAWSTIWGGIQDVVLRVVGTIKAIAQGMWDGITSGLKAVVNGGIHIINFAISGINHLIDIANDIPFVDIPHISEIPYLARGGMTTGPMAAIIGDNPNGQEVVLPTDSPRTVAALSAALEKAGARNGGPGGGVSFEINEATDADAVAAQVLRRMRLVGAV
jgi:phage-related protein